MTVKDIYRHHAVVSHITDGDTYVFDLLLTPHTRQLVTVRLLGVDAPSRFAAEGKAATAEVTALLGTDVVLVETDWTLDRYGRVLSRIVLADGRDLADVLVAGKHAVYWDGHGPHPDQPGRETATARPVPTFGIGGWTASWPEMTH